MCYLWSFWLDHNLVLGEWHLSGTQLIELVYFVSYTWPHFMSYTQLCCIPLYSKILKRRPTYRFCGKLTWRTIQQKFVRNFHQYRSLPKTRREEGCNFNTSTYDYLVVIGLGTGLVGVKEEGPALIVNTVCIYTWVCFRYKRLFRAGEWFQVCPR